MRSGRWNGAAGLLLATAATTAILLLVALDQSGLRGPPGFGPAQSVAVGLLALLAGAGALLWLRASGSATRLALVAGGVALVIGGPAVALASAAAGERGVDLRHNHTVGLAKLRDSVLGPAGLGRTGVCRCAPDERSRIPLPGGFETSAAVYLPDGPGPFPGILLVHGNVWNGSDASTYRVMAEALSSGGYAVMMFDVVGFGRSDDPYSRGPEGMVYAFDRPAQARAALDALVARSDIDASDITILGHSAGSGPAIVVGTSDPRVDRIATMVSPPPPEALEPADEGAGRAAYFDERADDQYRYIYGHDVPGWFRREMKPDDSATYHASALRLKEAGHPPYLLILGERDEPGGHAEELRILGRMTPPADVLPVPRSDHYLNSAQSLGLVFFDRGVAEAFGAGMVEWLVATR